MTQETFPVHVEEVHSGDDLTIMVNLGVDGLHKRVRARLAGVDTPDAHKAAPNTVAGRIRDEVRRMTKGRCRVVVKSRTWNSWIVELFIIDGDHETSLNEHLISQGHLFNRMKPEQA